MRGIVAVVVASESATGYVAEAIGELTAHLPPSGQPGICPLCSTESWPCARFHRAAHQVTTAGLRLGDWIPTDLHPRLWPQPQPRFPVP